jgi:Family of unknown function (DUF6529)
MTTAQSIEHPDASGPSNVRVAQVAAVGAAVAVILGAYAKVHDPTGETIYRFGFDKMLAMKAWFATVAVALALWQIASAAWMWGRLPGAGAAPCWVAPTHRWSGTLAFLFTLPVAYHCLWSLGYQDTDARVMAHSLFGLAFFGAFATKLLALRTERLPARALPVIAATMSVVLVGIWLTSARWYFQNAGFPGL